MLIFKIFCYLKNSFYIKLTILNYSQIWDKIYSSQFVKCCSKYNWQKLEWQIKVFEWYLTNLIHKIIIGIFNFADCTFSNILQNNIAPFNIKSEGRFVKNFNAYVKYLNDI